MNALTTAAKTAHTLSLAAMEEASREGLRVADLEHLLLALTVSDQVGGQVLRRLGITLDAARTAVAEQHADRLASLGITVTPDTTGRIVFHETGGYEWSDRSKRVINLSIAGERSGDAAAVLRVLVAEPSGTIDGLLRHLDSTPDAVLAALDEAERYPAHTMRPTVEPGPLGGASDSFVPASPERTWALLSDPALMATWDSSVGSVVDAPVSPLVGARWEARSPIERPDGKRLRVKRDLVRQCVELMEREEHRVLAWRTSYPDAVRANTRRVRIELEPAAAGTRLRITLDWERPPGARRRTVVGTLFRPLTRAAVRFQAQQIGAGIGRAFR